MSLMPLGLPKSLSLSSASARVAGGAAFSPGAEGNRASSPFVYVLVERLRETETILGIASDEATAARVLADYPRHQLLVRSYRLDQFDPLTLSPQ